MEICFLEVLKVKQNETMFNETIANLKLSNKSLVLEVEKTKLSYEEAQQRADCYKNKFLKLVAMVCYTIITVMRKECLIILVEC